MLHARNLWSRRKSVARDDPENFLAAKYFSIVAKTSGPKRGFDSTLAKLTADNRLKRSFLTVD